MNNRVKKIEISCIRKFYNKVSQYPGAISLTLGQPDFPTPNNIKEAMVKAIENNKTVYTPNIGIQPLRDEISKYLLQKNINYKSDEICITVGGSEALYIAFQGLLNEGDQILIPNPAYPAYEAIANILGLEIIEYSLDEEFLVDINKITKLLEENNIKAIVLSYPSNPTGAILTKELQEKLYNLLIDKDIYIISDEIYGELIYDDEYISLAQKEDILNKFIYISGFSKTFSMTGLRLGYICAKSDIMKELLKVHQYSVSCAPSIVQWGVVEGLKNSMAEVEIMRNSFKHRRNYCYKRLISMGFSCNLPKGAFYIFPSIKAFNMDSESFCDALLEDKKVACVPGRAFGSNGDHYIRISYCYGEKDLEEALDKLERWTKKFLK